MRGILKRLYDSPVLWFIVVVFWILFAATYWYELATEGYSTLKLVKASLATALAGGWVIGNFIVNRGWRRPNDDS